MYAYQTLKTEELPSETIEQVNTSDVPKQWRGTEPRLLIIASPDDMDEARQFVTDEAMLALKQLDFTTHFAVIAFRGLQNSGHGGFQIERIVRQGSEIFLYSQAGSIGGVPAETSPYHLIRVLKKGRWGGVFAFKLYFGENKPDVASVSHRIP